LLSEIGDPKPLIDYTGVSGLIVAKTILNLSNVIVDFRNILLEQPYLFRYVLRVIPIEIVVKTSLSKIKMAVQKLSFKIGNYETFRITVEKRLTNLSKIEIIEAAANDIKRKVNLEKPDKIILIEVIGKLTGISIVPPNGFLSVLKEKML
jgi:tRNA acetyltransferase TAN1